MISATLSNAWRLYRKHFGVIAAVVIIVWLPCELLESYLEAFVFDQDNFYRSIRFTQFLDHFFGIIATAGVTYVALLAYAGQSASFGDAMGAGLRSWGRMWWTRLLCGFAFVLGMLCFVIPGVYLLTRLCFAETVAVVEQVSGSRAMGRSFELTKGRFWQTFRLGIVIPLVVAVPSWGLVFAMSLIPGFDYWMIDALVQLVGDVLAAFCAVAFYCAYEAFCQAPEIPLGSGGASDLSLSEPT